MYEKFCPICGYSWTQFKSSGLLGCPNCYNQFERELLPTLKKLQNDVVHTGTSPKLSNTDKLLFEEYKRLKSEKELAGINGDFSKMAQISSELTCLVEELKERGIL